MTPGSGTIRRRVSVIVTARSAVAATTGGLIFAANPITCVPADRAGCTEPLVVGKSLDSVVPAK
jgi:hypothetical protein